MSEPPASTSDRVLPPGIPPAAASLEETASAQPPRSSARPRRTKPQPLADEIRAEELIPGAPSRNGGRLLTEDRDPWTHNAWDQVEWDNELEQFARDAVDRQRDSPVPKELQDKYNADPAGQWDAFYARNKDNFFKDRSWLRTEFPELADTLKPDAGPKRVVEIGCGNGSTLFPLLAANENPHLKLHGYDYSKEAVAVVKAHSSFDPTFLTCDVWDLSSSAGLPPSLEPNSVDVVTMIFVLSALHPNEWAQAVKNTYQLLKPGGVLLFRDYGRNDLAQLRFKAGRFMQDGLYVRGDATRVYFFERDELVHIFGGVRSSLADPAAIPPSASPTPQAAPRAATPADLSTMTTSLVELPSGEISTEVSISHEAVLSSSTAPSESESSKPTLSIPATPLTPYNLDLLQLGVDRRLLLNRKRQLKMMRIWLQGRWRKPLGAPSVEALDAA
ncbi:hypothetical protein JCM21900_006192 [Sporobolomyces salmonicolor]